MAEPKKSGRITLIALLFLLSGGAYYGVRYLNDAPAEELVKSAAAGKAAQSLSTESEYQLPERQSAGSSNAAVPSEVGHAYGSFESEAGLQGFQPAALYVEYLDEANNGNLNAQYVLVTALDECRHGPTIIDEIARLERSGLTEDALHAVKKKFQRCEPLYELIPNLEKEYQQRYRAVRDAKHPLILVKQRNIAVDEKRQRVIDAISQDYPEPYLYSSAYLEAARLYREYPEKLSIIREEAWLMLYCQVSFHCDSKRELEYLRTVKYHAHEVDEILATHSSIAAAIKRRDWDALGL